MVAVGLSAAAVGASVADSVVFIVEFTVASVGTSVVLTPVEFPASVPLGSGVAELIGSPLAGVALMEELPTGSVAPCARRPHMTVNIRGKKHHWMEVISSKEP